jgi:putative transposase
VPRDRNGTFEPQIIPKHERRSSGFDEMILSRYARVMSTRDIKVTWKSSMESRSARR